MIGGKQAKNLHHFTFSEKMSNMYIESATMYVHVRHHNGQQHHGGPVDKKCNFHIRIREQLPSPVMPNSQSSPSSKRESPVIVDYG